MTGRHHKPARPESFEARISLIERRLTERRNHIDVALAEIADTIRRQLVSPGAIFAAGLVGVMVERNPRLREWMLRTILATSNATLRLLLVAARRGDERCGATEIRQPAMAAPLERAAHPRGDRSTADHAGAVYAGGQYHA